MTFYIGFEIHKLRIRMRLLSDKCVGTALHNCDPSIRIFHDEFTVLARNKDVVP